MNCRLIDDTEFLNDLNNIVMNTSEEFDPISSFKTEIIKLKSKYRDSSEFEDAVKEYLEDDLGFYNISFIDEKIADDFRNSIDDIFKENPQIEEGESKLDSLSPNTNVSQVRGQFLNRYFAGVSSSKLVFQKNFKNQVIRKLFIKEDEGESSLITSLEEVNESLQNYRESLKSIVADFLRSKVNDNAAKTFEYLFDNNMYAAIRHLDKIYKNTYTFPISLIARLPEYGDPNSKLTSQQRKTLEAWQAYIILSNFDDLLSISLGKSIEIKNHGEYNLDNSKKYRLKTADKVIHTWRDDNVDVDETEELGSLAILFLESLNIYDKSGPTNDTLDFANIKVSIGQLMKILDVQPNTKFLDETVSDKTYSYEIKPILKSEYSNIYGDDYLNYLLDTYVVGKTFKQVLASAKLHPQILMPLLFRLTQPIQDSLGNYNPYSNLFNRSPKTAETIRSLYYQLFSPESDSLFSMNTKRFGFDPNAQSIFQYITTTFLNIENKQQLEYQKTEDGIIAINLGEKMRNDRLKNFQRALEAKFTKTNPLSTKIGNIHKFFNFEIEDNLDSKSGNKGITILFDDYKIKVNPDFTIQISDSEDKPIKDSNIYEKFIPIYQEVLDMEFDIRTQSILSAQKGTLKEVMELTSHMLYNFIVSKHMMNTTNNTYEEEVKNYYTLSQILKNYPKSAYSSIQPSIIIGTEYNGILTTLSKVKDIIEGYSEINSVKDGERKQISTLGLSMLLSKYNEIIENYGKREDSPIKHFSIYDLFEGAELMRDYAESGNNKQAKKFTEPELVTISFIYDMYGDMYELDESGENLVVKNGGTLRVMGPVVSDKNNLIKLRFNWDALIPEKYRQLLGRENSNERITLRNLNNEDLKTIIKLEFGEYYQNVYNYIKSQWNILNEIQEGKSQNYIDEAIDSLELELPKGKLFDWDSNFQEANLYYGNQTLSILRRAIYLAQQDGNDIEIIDQVHYRKGKDGKILNNPSLIHQLQIFGKLPGGEQYEEFWNRKEKQLFIDFLQTETELQVKEGNVPKKGVAIKAALQHNDGWIKGENIAIAKIHENDWTRVIATKTDFKEWFSYKRMCQYYGDNLPSNLNIDNPDANLTDILNEIVKNNQKYKVIENLDTISKKNKLYDYENFSEEKLLALAKSLYSATRLKYNPNLTSEDIQTSFDKKIKKDFTKKNEKIDTEALIEYINRKTILNNFEKYISEQDNISVELNPEIIKHNLLDFYLSEEFILSTTGTHVSQPSKIEDNIIEREAEQFGQAVKRYVAYTASKHREEANTLNGITEDINISIIEDDYDFSYNYAGETGRVKVFDGASFYNITMNYLDNNSLGADAMGIDKKPFAHYQGVKSGIGFILKTAGFAMTNDRIRSSKFDARINKQMLDLKWDSAKVQKIINPNWNPSQEKYIPDWTKDYNGNTIDYGEWFAYRQDKKGNWHWYKHRINNGNVEYKQVLNNGTPLNSEDNWKIYKKCSDINSNYELWEVFGGAYSGHLQKNSNGTETLVYENDESSALKLVQAINNVGIKKSINGKQIDKVFDQDGVNQYLKKAMIHIIATEGAVKYGGANINSKEAYHKNDYNLTYMTIKSYDLGEQLDAEHSAEDGKVSLMTQVVNALGARGYTSYEAKECYEALANIAEYITGDILRAMETDDPDLIDSVMSKSIYKTLLKTSDQDGDMLNALAESLLGDINSSSFNKEEIVQKFPISHPAVYNKVLSSLASQLEKGIRLKFKGGMLVLNPSNKRMTVINGHLSGYYDTHLDELKKLEKNSKLNPISSIADIKLGYNYKNVLTGELVQINKPTDIYQLKESINNKNTYYETFIDDDGYPLGRDLSTYQSSFEDIEGNRYNSWELDSVRMLQFLQEGEKDGKKVDIGFLIPPSETDEDKISFQLRLQENWDKLNTLQKAWNIYINPEFLELLNVEQQEEASRLQLSDEIKEIGIRNWLIRRFQKELNALSSGIETEVEVDGKIVQVNKSKTKVHPYGIILPMIYKSIFGLKEQDNLSNIKNDRNFFIKRQLENWKSKIADQNVYDLELKTLDGNHIYLGQPLGVLMDSTTYQEVELEFPTNFELDGDVLYRVTPLGERLYSVPYTVENGNIIPDIQVYKHKATGTEIIYSSNLTHFLDEFNYNQIIISQRNDSTKPNSLESIDKVELLKAINASTNKVARRKINTITKIVSNIVNRKSNNLTNVEDSIIDIIENDSDSENVRGLLNNLIGYESDEPYSLEELIQFDKETLESFINSDYTYHEKQVEKLQEDLSKNLFGQELINNNKFFKGLILSGQDVHTSFLQSLEMIVSRTPAQSQQSFMSMVVEAFGVENKNSAYVSRDQLWLQGSDYAL